MHPISGVRLEVAQAGVKYAGRNDLLVIAIEEGAKCSRCVHPERFAAAPVLIGREHIANGDIRYLVVNSGNANACTGERGMRDARATPIRGRAYRCETPSGDSFLHGCYWRIPAD